MIGNRIARTQQDTKLFIRELFLLNPPKCLVDRVDGTVSAACDHHGLRRLRSEPQSQRASSSCHEDVAIRSCDGFKSINVDSRVSLPFKMMAIFASDFIEGFC